jgi:hypothetical protein
MDNQTIDPHPLYDKNYYGDENHLGLFGEKRPVHPDKRADKHYRISDLLDAVINDGDVPFSERGGREIYPEEK